VREARERPLFPSIGLFSVDARVQQGAWGSSVLLPPCFPHAEIFRLKLNNRTIQKLAPPVNKRDVIYFDRDVAGFGLRLRRSGDGQVRRTWIVQYRFHGRTRRVLIGSAEVLGAEDARAQAKKILGAVALGRDPQAERASARLKQAHTLKSVADAYLEDRKDELRPASYRVTKLYLSGKTYFGALHSTALGDITRADVAARIGAIKRNSGMVTASRARSALSSLFVWAMGEGLAEANPVIGTNQPDTSEPRDRVLDDDELAAIWKASGDGEFGKVLKLLMLLGARRQEIGGMRWSEIGRDKGEWTLPKERAKNKRELTLPLPPAAMSILTSMPEIVGRPHVFGARSSTGFCHWSRGKAELDQRLGDSVRPWRIHDVRRSVATHLADDLNVQPHIIECILGHYGGFRRGVAQVYNKSPYMNEMRAALVAWSERLQSLVAGSARKIVAFPQKSAPGA
jgi:integrase